MPKIPVVFTGSHAATTALAVIGEVKAEGLPWEIHFIGARRAVEGKSVSTLESQVMAGEDVYFHAIVAGRLQRRFNFWTIPSLLKIPVSFIHAFYVLVTIKPKVILSFGGSVGFVVVLAGRFLRIPSVVHEQTTAAGRANLASAPFARVVALARESSRRFFPKEKIRVVGNPILPFLAAIRPKQKSGNPPTIYITAGSRGSLIINELIEPILRKLLTDYRLIHQTGKLDEARFKKIKDNLPSALSENYEVFSHVNPPELEAIYKQTDIVVSRSGANSVAEIMATKRPALLIPIPWSFQNEQNKNAAYARQFGIAGVLNQETLTAKRLLNEINRLKADWIKIIKSVRAKKSPDLGAAHALVEILKAEIG